MNLSIVIAAYNRKKSLNRLLESLMKSKYPPEFEIELIISIDKSENTEVEKTANQFMWPYGKKTVIAHERNLGLKNHILFCGDLTQSRDNIILLEDDLYVSQNFINFSLESIKKFEFDSKIAGISLYSHCFNETAKLPFTPLISRYDNYFMQLPSSWGQIWTKHQWKEFKDWYLNKNTIEFSIRYIPNNIYKWPDSSWKKVFTKYLIENDKFFVYPYESHSTNFGDPGENFWKINHNFQSQLQNYYKKTYNFSNLGEDTVIYDAYCESLNLKQFFKKNRNIDVIIDLYGEKIDFLQIDKEIYILSMRTIESPIIKSYGMNLKPIESNIVEEIEGENIKLYKINKGNKVISSSAFNKVIYEYFMPGLDVKKIKNYLRDKRTYKEILNYYMKILKK